jgi:hypothetical protein
MTSARRSRRTSGRVVAAPYRAKLEMHRKEEQEFAALAAAVRAIPTSHAISTDTVVG